MTNSKIKDLNQLAFKCHDMNKTTWNELYETETDLINDLMGIDTKSLKYRWVKGQSYIESFQKQIQAGRTLSEKQMIMLKRISKEIAKYYTLK